MTFTESWLIIKSGKIKELPTWHKRFCVNDEAKNQYCDNIIDKRYGRLKYN